MRWLVAALLLILSAVPAAAEKRIALTFDDVPRSRGPFLTPDERTNLILKGLRRAGVRQAAFFVTTGNLMKPDGAHGEQHIHAYTSAGHVIANHSEGHRHLSELSVTDYLGDLDHAATWLH